MNAFKLSALTASLLVLTACGSGGGGSEIDQSTTVGDNKEVVAPQPKSNSTSETTSTTTTSTTNSSATQSESPKSETASTSESKITEIDSKDIVDNNILRIDGVEYELIPPGIHTGYFIANNNIVSNERFDNLKYGLIETKTGLRMLSVGDVTPENEIPNTGVATYKGDYVHVDEQNLVIYRPAEDQAEFNVDFSNKTLTGRLNSAPVPEETIELSAKIEGNSFKGTNNNTYTQGRFFGSNASELSGVYQNEDQSYTGSYAAKKQ